MVAWLTLLIAIGMACSSWFSQGIVWTLFNSEQSPAAKLEDVIEYFQAFGAWAPVVYVGCVVLEVLIAPIPGVILYAPGGAVFGGLLGGFLSLIGNTLGAGMGCAVVRSIGGVWLERHFDSEKLKHLQNQLERRGFLIIFLLRINPLTSSDLVSYAAGLTRIPIWKVMLATAIGIAPLCFAQAYLAENMMQHFPWLLYPFMGCLVIYLAVVMITLLRVKKQVPRKEHPAR